MVRTGIDLVDGGSDKGMRDEFVYFINPAKQVCPKCGAIGSIMRYRDGMRIKNIRTCASCGCWIAYSIKKDGEKTTVMSYIDSKEANEMPDMEDDEKEEEFKIVEEDEDDFDMVVSTLKRIKKEINDRIFHENLSGITIEFRNGKVYMEIRKNMRQVI